MYLFSPHFTICLFRYSLRFYPDSDAMYNDSQNREKLKSFLDNFCDYLVKSVHKGKINLLHGTQSDSTRRPLSQGSNNENMQVLCPKLSRFALIVHVFFFNSLFTSLFI